MSSRPDNPTIGVVVPCFNEQETVPILLEELGAFVHSIPHEVFILFVDDGSTDHTFALLSEACRTEHRLACLRLSRNFGHQAAVSAGLRYIRGDVVVVLDADLQDPPDVIPRLLEKWNEGYDVVFGIRRNRKESLPLRAAYAAFYRLLRRIANVNIPADAGDFALMDRAIVDRLNALPERHRFVRGLRGWLGFKQTGILYERRRRAAGQPKYNLKRLANLAIDGLISFSSVPLRIASWVGALASGLALVFLLWAVFSALFFDSTPSGWASLVVLIMFFGGIQLIVLGIIGEYLGRVFEEVKGRPLYVTSEVTGWLGRESVYPP